MIVILALILVLVPAPLLSQQQDSLRIMPLGDSITMGIGSSHEGGYRQPLYWDYTIQGIHFDFVGTQNDGSGFDTDHEGHGGKRSNWLADTVAYFYDYSDPDVILLHIGTNDITGEREIPDITDDVERILDQAHDHNPQMSMFVAGIVPRTDDKDDETTQLNQSILNLVGYKQWQGYDITFVDHNSAFKAVVNWETELMADTRHPNDSGYVLMAEVWADSLGIEPPVDSIAPSPVVDLTVDQVGPATVSLSWTSPGDDSTIGLASSYDIRYDTVPITEGTFSQALEARSAPDPAVSGSSEGYIVSGLTPGTGYYFAVKSYDEVPNTSGISNVPSVITVDDPTVFVDDFNRGSFGTRWVVSDSVVLEDDMLTQHFAESSIWTVRALYSYARNPESAMFRYGHENSSVENGAVGVVMLRNSLNLSSGRGYLIRYYNFAYHLYIMNNQLEPQELGVPVPEPNPPVAGDLFEVVHERVGSENHFHVYLNEDLQGTLVDEFGILDPTTHYAGVAFENEIATRIGSVDDFTIGGAAGNNPPEIFSLLVPVDGDTLNGMEHMFVWERTIDGDSASTVTYDLYLDTDTLFLRGPVATDLLDTAYVLNTDTLDDGTYYWKVIAYDGFGDGTSSLDVFDFVFLTGSGIDDDHPLTPGLPRVVALAQNYPNPFNPMTVIAYDVPVEEGRGEDEAVPVSLRIYSSRGKLVRTLVDEAQTPGTYRVTWNGRDEYGAPAHTGTYLYLLRIDQKQISRKMVLVR